MKTSKSYYSFETERLFIRPMILKDAPFLLSILNTPKWIANIGDRNVHSIADAQRYIQTKMLPQLVELGYGNYVIIRKSDKIIVGNCGLYNRDGVDGIDIGYALLPDYERNGYAFEATSKLLEVAENEFNLSKVSAITIKENRASQNLLEKLGLQFKESINIPNDDTALLLYVINFKNNNR